MAKFVLLGLLLLCLILVGECYNLPGGENIAITGQGSAGTDSSPPVYDYPKTTVITRDPAKYIVPSINIIKTTPEANPSSEGNNASGLSSATPTMVFTMTSDVAGMGSFAVRSNLDGHDKEDYKAFQTISAKYGNLTQSREMRFAEAEQTGSDLSYSLASIDTQDSIKFYGQSYSDISRFQNKDDLIQENLKSGAISKASRFISQYYAQVSLADNGTKKLYNNYTVYNIDTRFVGSSDLHAITNGTEIRQSYIGQIALERKIASQFMANETLLDDEWLPSCYLSYEPPK
jgi:hypothetical protein